MNYYSKKIKLPREYWEKGKSKFLFCRLSEGHHNPLKKSPKVKDLGRIQCKWAKSLGELEGTHQEVWGTVDYTNRRKPCVFFGLYDLRDYYYLWRHRSKVWILWCGSDITNLKNKFLFNNGKLKNFSKLFPFFHCYILKLLKKAEHWCENEVEQEVLKELGIKAQVGMSYLGDVNLPITYKYAERPKAFISCGKGRQLEYGFGMIEDIAKELSNMDFYLYGDEWKTKHKNVIVRGRVSKKVFNDETADMQIGLRLNKFDGFSEILAKAMLRGQYAVSRISYPFIPEYNNNIFLIRHLERLAKERRPNIARNYYIKNLNNFVWAKRK